VIRRPYVLLILLFFLLPCILFSENSDGYVRLILHERTGRFSLYYLTDPETMRYEPLFNSSDPRASFLSVHVNGKSYRLGDSKVFKISLERRNGDPALVFRARTLTISQVFTVIKTDNSNTANGVMVTVIIENTGKRELTVGLRMVIDTELGENYGRIPFITDNRMIRSETQIDSAADDKYWITRGENLSLMGSIINPLNNNSTVPTYVHMANWKRLNESAWGLRYVEERSFNNLPYSVRDSAVCYFWQPEPLAIGGVFTYTVFLTTEDIAWYNPRVSPPVTETPVAIIMEKEPEPELVPEPIETMIDDMITEIEEVLATVELETESEIELEPPTIDIPALQEDALTQAIENEGDPDMLFLIKLQELLEQFIAGEIYMNEADLMEIEGAVVKLKDRY